MTERPNTAITYQYRDGSNYKLDHTVVFPGQITLEIRDRLVGALLPSQDEEVWGTIIPGQVGLLDLQDQFYKREIRLLEAMLSPSEGPVSVQIEDRDRYEDLLREMRATRPMWRDGDDHIYHDVLDITLTDQAPTDPRPIFDFIHEVAAHQWDERWLPACHAVMERNYQAHLRDMDEGDGPEA